MSTGINRAATDSTATPADAPVAHQSPLKSKTFWFAFAGAVFHIATDWRNPDAWATGVSAVGAAYGLREAVSKNGYGV